MPTDEQRALWAAIWAHPDEDTPRLVYADWLQEHGDETRAEFIRVQIALAKLGTDRRKGRKERPALEVREKALLAAHREDWLAPIVRSYLSALKSFTVHGALALHSRLLFRRGFAAVPHIHLNAAQLLELAGTTEPLESVRVRIERNGQSPSGIESLARWDGSNSVTGLVIAGAADEDIIAIVQSGHFRYLSELYLIHGAVSDAGVCELVRWPFVAGLRELGLTNNPFTDAGAFALAESPRLTGLGILNATRSFVEQDGRAALRDRFGPKVLLDPEP